MLTKSHSFAGAVILVLLGTFAQTAQATPNFPGVVKNKLGLDSAPPCGLCHTDPKGGGPLGTLFGKAVQAAGLKANDTQKLEEILDSFEASKLDSDGDKSSNIAELKAGTDPNKPEAPKPDVGAGGTGGASSGGLSAAGAPGKPPVSSPASTVSTSGVSAGGASSGVAPKVGAGGSSAKSTNGLSAPGSNDTWDEGCTVTAVIGNDSTSRFGFIAAAALGLGWSIRRRRRC